MSRKIQPSWLILMIIILFNIATPMTQCKVPPVLPVLMKEFNFSAGTASMLMSVFALTGMIIGIPAGFIFRHAGIRITGAIVTISFAGGAVLGALSNGFTVLLLSRFIEGIGLSLASIMGPPVLSVNFPGRKLVKAMGLSSVSVPAGLLLTFIISPFVENMWGWKAIWWIIAAYSFIIGVVYFFTVGSVKVDVHHEKAEKIPARKNTGKVIKNRDIWFMSCLLCCFNIIFSIFLTWFPSYSHSVRGLSLTEADILSSVMTVFLMISGPLGGWLTGRFESRKAVYVFPLFVFIIVLAITPFTATPALSIVMAVLGLVISFVPTALFSELTDIVKDHRMQGIAMGITLIGQNAGMLIGPTLFGIMLDHGFSWQTSFLSFIPAGIIGIVSGLMVKGSKRQSVH